jgi:uncharacterized small protein (DUF1192 family)
MSNKPKRRLNTSGLTKIFSRYNADHDLGPDAPIPWHVNELAELVHVLVEHVEDLEAEIERIKATQEKSNE